MLAIYYDTKQMTDSDERGDFLYSDWFKKAAEVSYVDKMVSVFSSVSVFV